MIPRYLLYVLSPRWKLTLTKPQVKGSL
jgi:hypothetical protein